MSFLVSAVRDVTFKFPAAKETTRTASETIAGPAESGHVTICLQSYDFAYSGQRNFDFGQMAVQLSIVREPNRWKAVCTATMRDDKKDQRQWEGTVVALVQHLVPA
jgi:hypothetical protein